MDATLSEQIQSTLDALALSHTRAEQVTQTMRRLGIHFGLAFDFPDDDITQIMGKMRYMKRLAERREAAELSPTPSACTRSLAQRARRRTSRTGVARVGEAHYP